jgi:hypothetical protein
MAHLVHAEILFNPNRWAESIPVAEVLTVDDALRAADIVATECKGAIDETGWKPHPELVAALKQVQILIDGLESYAAQGIHRLKPDFTVKLRAALLARGLALYAETQRLIASWGGHVDAEQARASRQKQVVGDLLLFDLPVLVVAVGLGWLWWTSERGRHASSWLADLGL